MRSDLFAQDNLEKQSQERFVLQNAQMLRVHLGQDVLATKGCMVAYQGQVRFDHEKSGGFAKLAKMKPIVKLDRTLVAVEAR